MVNRKRTSAPRVPVILTIAGYDPSSGAGITADVKTAAAHDCFAISCITALTVQSSQGVRRVECLEKYFITETLEELADDFTIAAVKIGMLGSAAAAEAVAAFLQRRRLPNVVIDPVFRSSSGSALLAQDALPVFRSTLLRLADVLTPNADEAAVLSGNRVESLEEMKEAALRLREMGAPNVVITGGHLRPPEDVLLVDSEEFHVLKGDFVPGPSTHGTGCAFSMALACNLARQSGVPVAAAKAKQFVASSMKKAPGVGKGTGPVL